MKKCFKKAKKNVAHGISQEFSFNSSKRYIKNKKVLNIGCGTGGYEYFAKNFPFMIIGTDIKKRALDVARADMPTVNFIRTSVMNLPFSDASFDVVTMWAVIEHLPVGTEVRALSEVNRILKRNGTLFTSTPSATISSKILDPGFFLTGHRHYSEKRLSRLLKSSNFSIKKVYYKGGVFSSLFSIVFYIFSHLFNGKVPHDFEKLMEGDYKPSKTSGCSKTFCSRDIYIIAKKVEDVDV